MAVVDDDGRPEEDFQLLISWSNGKNNFLAISKPCFEFWLLLHFDKGNQINNVDDCQKRLKKHMPNYEKNQLDEEKLRNNILTAIKNAKDKLNQSKNWKDGSYTKVHELVENIVTIQRF